MGVDDQYTKSLFDFDGTNHATTFVDLTGRTWSNDVSYPCWLSTDLYKFASGASLFPQTQATGGSIYAPIDADLLFGTGDFTIDLWAYFDSAGNGVSGYFKLDQDANNYLEFVYRHLSGDHCALSFHIQSGGSLLLDITGPGVTALVDNAWHHLAVIRNGASTYITLDGVVKASGASVTCPAFTGYARIGDTGAGARHLFTYADEFRISKFARWTSFPFSPPTVPYDESYSGATVVTSVPLQTVISLHASQEINSPMEITAVPLVAALSLQAASARGSNMMIQTLPALLGAGTLASRSGRLNAILPILTISADGKAGEVEILDSVLPSLRMSGTGLSGALGTLGVTLPVLSIVATGGLQRSAVATISLPFFYINAHGETKQATALYKVLALNLKNFAVSEYENFDFNSFAQFNGIYLGAKEDGIYPLVGSKDQGVDIDAVLTTGKAFVEHFRLRDFFSYGLSGGQKRSKLARGLHSGYTDFTIQNENGEPLDLDYFEVFGDPVRRKKH